MLTSVEPNRLTSVEPNRLASADPNRSTSTELITPDVGSFEDFYRSERDTLAGGLAVSIGDAALAAESIDEAMARAYQRWAKVSRYDAPAGWVYRVARNYAISRLRRRRFQSDTPVPELSLDAPIAHREMVETMRLLPEPQRQILVLKYLLGWTQDEIAVALKIRPGTVKSRIGRALEQLRTHLNEEDFR